MRSACGVLCLVFVASCGWRPVYAPASGGKPGVADRLDAVDVAVIHERTGQLLRQALQARMQRASDPPPPDYQLQASFSITTDGIAIAPDSSVTRMRMIGTSRYTLVALGTGSKTCLSGSARAVDGYDAENEQFFASDLESETVQRRLADAVAQQIVTKLARAMTTPGGMPCEVR